MPKVSVIMPLYNCEKYMEDAIDSILNQTYTDFELIIICDDPSENTIEILDRYKQKDNRIIVYYQDRKGLIYSLNYGCNIAKGIYIARMDADDISLPNRLNEQVKYMDAHPDIGILGSWVEYINENKRKINEFRPPVNQKVLPWYLLFGNFLAHPSIMMRREIIKTIGFYNMDAVHAEDYDLWIRASRITKIANIPKVLLKYRIQVESICSRYASIQEETVVRISHRAIKQYIGSDIDIETIKEFRNTVRGKPLGDVRQFDNVEKLILRICEKYVNDEAYDKKDKREVSKYTAKELFKLALINGKASIHSRLIILLKVIIQNPFVPIEMFYYWINITIMRFKSIKYRIINAG